MNMVVLKNTPICYHTREKKGVNQKESFSSVDTGIFSMDGNKIHNLGIESLRLGLGIASPAKGYRSSAVHTRSRGSLQRPPHYRIKRYIEFNNYTIINSTEMAHMNIISKLHYCLLL